MHCCTTIRIPSSNARHASLEERTATSHLPERCSAAKEITMSQTVADFVWMRLHAWGVRRVFGYPGDGIGGLMAALNRTEGTIDFVQVRHEEMAALMACATAKFAGEVGICLATSGPGAVHLLNGLYDAALDHLQGLRAPGFKSIADVVGARAYRMGAAQTLALNGTDSPLRDTGLEGADAPDLPGDPGGAVHHR